MQRTNASWSSPVWLPAALVFLTSGLVAACNPDGPTHLSGPEPSVDITSPRQGDTLSPSSAWIRVLARLNAGAGRLESIDILSNGTIDPSLAVPQPWLQPNEPPESATAPTSWDLEQFARPTSSERFVVTVRMRYWTDSTCTSLERGCKRDTRSDSVVVVAPVLDLTVSRVEPETTRVRAFSFVVRPVGTIFDLKLTAQLDPGTASAQNLPVAIASELHTVSAVIDVAGTHRIVVSASNARGNVDTLVKTIVSAVPERIYSVRPLPTLGGKPDALSGRPAAVIAGINVHGVAVGNARDAAGETRAVVWRDGIIETLPDAMLGTSFATDINDDGWIVGQAHRPDHCRESAVWIGGVRHSLPLGQTSDPSSCSGATAVAVSNNGTILEGIGINQSKLWRHGVTPTVLSFGAVDVNDNDQAVGWSGDGSFGETRASYGASLPSMIPSPGGCGLGHTFSRATHINNSGQIAGTTKLCPTYAFFGRAGEPAFDATRIVGSEAVPVGLNETAVLLWASGTGYLWSGSTLTRILVDDVKWRIDALGPMNAAGLITGLATERATAIQSPVILSPP